MSPKEPEAPAQPDLKPEFAGLLAALREAQASESAEEATAAVSKALGDLSPEDRARVLNTSAVQRLIEEATERGSGKLPPGHKLKDAKGRFYGKVAWTAADWKRWADENDAWVTWVPNTTRNITVNGVTQHVQAGVEVRTPSVFKSVHDEAYAAEINKRRTDEKIMREMFGGYGAVYDVE